MLRVSKSISCVHLGLSEGSVINKKDQTYSVLSNKLNYPCIRLLERIPDSMTRNETTLSPDTCHASWSPLHSPSGESCGQGELSR